MIALKRGRYNAKTTATSYGILIELLREDYCAMVFTDDHQKAIESLEEVEEPVLIGKSSDSRTYFWHID